MKNSIYFDFRTVRAQALMPINVEVFHLEEKNDFIIHSFLSVNFDTNMGAHYKGYSPLLNRRTYQKSCTLWGVLNGKRALIGRKALSQNHTVANFELRALVQQPTE